MVIISVYAADIWLFNYGITKSYRAVPSPYNILILCVVIDACDKSFTDNGTLRWNTGGSTVAGGTGVNIILYGPLYRCSQAIENKLMENILKSLKSIVSYSNFF